MTDTADNIFPRLTVLVVNDDENMIRLLSTVLVSLGVRQTQVIGAKGREGAMRRLNETRVDVVLLGHQPPRLDGVALARHMRDETASSNPYVPIIMVTARATPETVEQARSAGVHEFLVTPISVKAVADRITVAFARPRPFVKVPDYFGPDRRRRSSAIAKDRRAGERQEIDDD
ncbi:response regulator [Marinibaculum pumilum]|uniref:Response regulator n=1 Tax=Marinibaculum pumilum TaxID=1766165 RepID=A0ABV7L015_9PROT